MLRRTSTFPMQDVSVYSLNGENSIFDSVEFILNNKIVSLMIFAKAQKGTVILRPINKLLELIRRLLLILILF